MRPSHFYINSSPRSSSQKSWDQKTPIKSTTDSSEKEDDLRKAENGREAAKNITLQEEKKRNSLITWKRIHHPGNIESVVGNGPLERLLNSVAEYPNDQFRIIRIKPKNPKSTLFSINEVLSFVKKEKNKYAK